MKLFAPCLALLAPLAASAQTAIGVDDACMSEWSAECGISQETWNAACARGDTPAEILAASRAAAAPKETQTRRTPIQGAVGGVKLSPGGAAVDSQGSAANCSESDVTWRPGNANSDAFKIIPLGQTVAYRVYDGQLRGEYGDRVELYEARGMVMYLSGHPCEIKASPLDGCYADATKQIGFAGVAFWSARKAAEMVAEGKRRGLTAGKDAPTPCAPVPAGRSGGSDYWYVNVRAAGPCAAGMRKTDGGLTAEGECIGAIHYFGGQRRQSGGSGDGGAVPSGAPGPAVGGGVTCKGSSPAGPCYWQAKYSVNNQTIPCAIPGFSPTHAACGCDPAATSLTRPGPLNSSPCPR